MTRPASRPAERCEPRAIQNQASGPAGRVLTLVNARPDGRSPAEATRISDWAMQWKSKSQCYRRAAAGDKRLNPRYEPHRAWPRRFRGGAPARRYGLAPRIARSFVAC